jgi:cation transport ATPase
MVSNTVYTDYFMYAIGPISILYLAYEMKGFSIIENKKLVAAVIFMLFSIVFWAFFEQSGGSLSDFAAEVLSTKQADWVKERTASGSKVLLVADGHYDASALIEADVALAFGAGHNVHLDSANLILVSQDPQVIPKLLKLSKVSQSRARWNLIFGLVISVALMAAGFLNYPAPAIALVGLLASWLLLRRVVRLHK